MNYRRNTVTGRDKRIKSETLTAKRSHEPETRVQVIQKLISSLSFPKCSTVICMTDVDSISV